MIIRATRSGPAMTSTLVLALTLAIPLAAAGGDASVPGAADLPVATVDAVVPRAASEAEPASERAGDERPSTPAFLAERRNAEPALRAPTQGAGSLLRLLVGLVVVLATLFALAWLVRRTGAVSAGRGGLVRVLASAAVGQRERVVLVEVGDQQLLVGVAPGSVRTLMEFATPVADGSMVGAGGGAFAQQLQSLLRRGEVAR
jgi:flagellar protein FliO/FliZ